VEEDGTHCADDDAGNGRRRRRTDGRNGRYNLAQLELVKDGGLTCGIKADYVACRECVCVREREREEKRGRRSNVVFLSLFFLHRLFLDQ
jgi:hypothetical protein